MRISEGIEVNLLFPTETNDGTAVAVTVPMIITTALAVLLLINRSHYLPNSYVQSYHPHFPYSSSHI